MLGGVTTYYVGTHFEWTGSTSTMVKYYYAGGRRVAMRVGSNALYYLLGDHLGSTAITANSNGTLYTEQRYYPWGDTRYNSPATTPTAYQYTGQRKDATGLYFYNARYYDPLLGRFLQADTIIPSPGNPQSFNRYAYGYNNPVKYLDPSGHDPLDHQWQEEFEKYHDCSPDWHDRLIRLFSIAYPDEWDWSAFYEANGDYIEGSIERVFRDEKPTGRSWEGIPQALENMAGWYEKGENGLLTRDIGTLFGGLQDRLTASAWESISHRNNPVQPWVYVSSEGLPTWLTGTSDRDANIHHWAWGLAMGSEYAVGGSVINMGRELTQFRGDFRNTWSDIVIGNAGASLGCSLRVLGAYDIRWQFNFHMLQPTRPRGGK